MNSLNSDQKSFISWGEDEEPVALSQHYWKKDK